MHPGRGHSGKRKRGDRTSSQDDGSTRPSPHRPANMQMAQQSRDQEFRNRPNSLPGSRRQSRSARGGYTPRHEGAAPKDPSTGVNAIQPSPKAHVPSSPSIPPAQRTPVEVSRTEPSPQPAVSDNATVGAAAPAPDEPLPSPNFNDYITDDVLARWRDTGRKDLLASAIQAQHDEDAIALGTIFQELLRLSSSGRLDSNDAGNLLRELFELPPHADMESSMDGSGPTAMFDARLLFLDCLSVFADDEVPPSLRDFVIATGIAPSLLRRHLEVPLLEALGLVRSTFNRMGIRKTTNLLYRQSNYNLLREESEGYSKLMTELFTTSNNGPPTGETVEATFERVKALVGAFDLDVGRVLDVVLDVFASVLVKQNRFYVKFLRTSSWWPKQGRLEKLPGSDIDESLPSWALPGAPHWQSDEDEKQALKERKVERDRACWARVAQVGVKAFFEVGRLRMSPDQLPQAGDEEGDAAVTDLEPFLEWVKSTGTLPGRGNRVAAQLLGFKLRFYASPARDATDVFPVNIIYLAALLIKIGFISLEDLYPHLYPTDDMMAAVKEQKMKEKAEQERLNRPGGGAANALSMAGALPDDTVPPPRGRDADASRNAAAKKAENSTEKPATLPTEAKDQMPEPSSQKVLLLKSLLCIGALPESLYMLGRFPWLPDAFPELLPYIHRILHYSIGKLCELARPLDDRDETRSSKLILDSDSSATAKGQARLLNIAPRKVLRWAQADRADDGDGIDYRFYWDDWADNVPECQSVDDLFLLLRTLGAFSGLKIGTDPALMIALVRIGKHSLTEDTSAKNMNRWVDLCKRLLVPALSLTKRNPGVVNEVWDLLKTFPTATRYSIYAEWYSGATSRLSDIRSAFEQSRAETKDVLKRISRTNIKPMARALAKVAFSSPGVVFAVAIGQIEAYDNLVEVVVECARYFTFLAYDVLTWSLMNALGGKGRNRVQADGMLTSKWLASLSLFAGRIFKRYSTLMNPSPVLQYVAEQLRKGNTVDLIVLKEMITSMAGIISDTNFNDSQILAMACGPLLRQQTLHQLLDKRHESRTTAKRFMRALTEPPLVGQLLISIAQERQTCIYGVEEIDAHVKIMGNLADEIHRVLVQYMDLLRSNLSPAEFNNLVPDVVALMSEYGVEPSVAFWISRASITDEMQEHDKFKAKEAQQEEARPATTDKGASQNKNGEAKPADSDVLVDKKGVSADADTSAVLELTNGDTEMKDIATALATPTEGVPAEPNAEPEPWHPVLSTLMNRVRSALPEEMWSALSPSFYITFWQLSLYDLTVSTKSYDEEITRLKNRWMAVNNDRSDMSVSGAARKEKDKKALTETQDRLRDELKGHIQAFSRTKTRLLKEKEHWFAGFWGRWDELNDALITYCIVPRMLVSPADALYCFKMIKLLHSAGTCNFRTMGLVDRILREARLSSLIFLCSAREAENLGRFLNELLKDLSRWHADKTIYEKEAHGVKKDLPGFAMKLTKDKEPETLLGYEDFRRLLYKWHRNLNSALKACLSGNEYMHIRNAIIILKAIHLYFPMVNWNGRDQVTAVTELSKSEKREDIKIAATSLLGNLKRREKQWMLPQAFNLIESGASAANAGSGPPRTTTPQPPHKPATSLNATAPAFQPKAEPNVNGSAEAKREGRKHEVEDGEIDDARAKRVRLMEQNPKLADTLQPMSRPGSQGTRADSTPKGSSNSGAVAHKPTPPSYPPSSTPASESRTTDSTSRNGVPSQMAQPQRTAPLPQVPPTRPDMARHGSSGNVSSQMQHTLPKRPEPLLPLETLSNGRDACPPDHAALNRRQESADLLNEPRTNGQPESIQTVA